MTIHHLMRESVFEPEHVTIMADAYEAACHRLGLAAGDPRTAILAKALVRIAPAGRRDAQWLCEQAVASLRDDLVTA